MKIPWTKGPWRIRESTHGLPPFVEAEKVSGMAYSLDVCGDDYTEYGDEKQREINMRLIALAPEMAEAIYKKEFSGIDDLKNIALKIKSICDKFD